MTSRILNTGAALAPCAFRAIGAVYGHASGCVGCAPALSRATSAMVRSWFDHGWTMVRPWLDDGSTIGRTMVPGAATGCTKAGGARNGTVHTRAKRPSSTTL